MFPYLQDFQEDLVFFLTIPAVTSSDFSALVMWAMESLWGKKPVIQILSMVVGLIVCYAMGTIWFMVVYTRTTGAVGIGTVLGWCVIPFIIPDLVKIALAFVLSRRVRKLVPMQ